MSDDRHVIDLLPGLALGGLELEEARRARKHIAVCPACREELARLEEVVGRLAMALPAADPPAGLEARIMERIKERIEQGAVPGGPAQDREETRTATRAQTRVPFFRHPAVGAAAAVLIVLLGAGNLLQWFRAPAQSRVTSAPGLETIVLVGVNTGQGAYGTVVLDTQDNGGVLAVRDLPRLDAAHQYQLWLIKDKERRSAGVFSVDEDGYGNLLLKVPQDFKGFTSIGISVEPAGGSPAPTGVRVAAGNL